MFWCLGCEACRILDPQSGMERTTPELEGKVLRTTKEVSQTILRDTT